MNKQPAYSDDSFWDKAGSSTKAAGKKALKPALQLYYAQAEEKTPAWAKTLVYSALAYFIWPADAVPDVIPAVGYGDDVAIMTAALGSIAAYITPAIKRKATIKLNQWLGKS